VSANIAVNARIRRSPARLCLMSVRGE